MRGTGTGNTDGATRICGALALAAVGWGAGAPAADPAFVTSKPDAGWSTEGYYVHNNMWGSKNAGPCSQTLYAWSYSDWYVVARMGKDPRDGAIKTYPNSHRDYADVPVRSFDTITSTFAEKSPGAGTYNVAFDIWLNNPPKPGHNEVMIWTDNQSSWDRRPSGKHLDTVTFGGRKYKAFRTDSGTYMAFLAEKNFHSGTVDVLEILKWAMSKGWLRPDSTLDQICFGVEIGSTVGTDGTFRFSNFSIDSNIAPVVELTAPATDAGYAAPASIALAASASDADGKVKKVEFCQGGKLLGAATAPPYAFTWNDVPAGAYSLTARATDDFGATVSSAAVSVTVSSAVARLVRPADGMTVGGAIGVEATAHDTAAGTADGAGIRSVLFELLSTEGAVSSHVDAASPYVWVLDTAPLAAGAYRLRATATSATVGAAVATVSITVDNAADTDADGLVDGWERFHFGDLAGKAEDDPDGDGATNRDELKGGTVPTDAGSVPADALVRTLVSYVTANAASLRGRRVYYRVGRGALQAMKLVSADADGVALENRGLVIAATWQSLDHEGAYRLLRPLAADAARFVDSVLRGRRAPPELPRPFEWIRQER